MNNDEVIKQRKELEELYKERKRVSKLVPKNFREQEKIVGYENHIDDLIKHGEKILRELEG